MEQAYLLIAIGVLFLAGLALEALGRITHVPRVTLMILLGALLGPPMLDVLPEALSSHDAVFSDVALTMVAFLLGGVLTRDTLTSHGREIIIISLCVVFVSVIVVAGGLMLIGFPAAIALLLGGIAAATAPAATHDIVRQSGRTDRFAKNVMGIVAIDDAWGLLVFSGLIVMAGIMGGQDTGQAFIHGVYEAGGGILLGVAIGIPAAYFTGRLKPGEPTLLEAIGIVALCAGCAIALEVSFLLAGMACGTVVVNLARHHDQPFHEIERIEWPFLLVFFVMAGASFDTGLIAEIGLVGLAYVALRAVSRMAGGISGAMLSGLGPKEGALTGMALMPQAGVAIGMALVAADRFPDFADTLMAITIATTILFEIGGPICTEIALRLAPREDD